ncbi:MAG TPA: hypothetical protein VFB59_04430 [Candidatus Saccharimonadales bacterium]|nr:hypothetical protein [Candidatus Saccharimonadales bacterium]
MDGLFNNREIAVGLWLVAFLIFAYTKVGRKSFADVLRSALTPKILIPLALSFVPTALVVAGLAYFDLWDLSVLKETIYWVIGTGLVMFGSFNKVTGVKELYKRTAKDTLKVVIVLEFLIWFYVFALWIELLLVPLTTLIVLLATVAKYQKGDGVELTRKFLNGLQVFIGLVILFFTAMAFLNDPKPLFTYQNLELLLLPIVLSFAYTISVYFVALYSKYELVFNRINHFMSVRKKDKRAIKLAAIKRCGLSVYVTGEMIRHLAINLNNKTTKAQALKLIRTFDPKQKSFL